MLKQKMTRPHPRRTAVGGHTAPGTAASFSDKFPGCDQDHLGTVRLWLLEREIRLAGRVRPHPYDDLGPEVSHLEPKRDLGTGVARIKEAVSKLR